MILFFDVETTGKADFKSDPSCDHQPRIVQLGALLTDKAGREISSINLIIKPNGWTIPDEAADIHGITTEVAEHFGVPIVRVLGVFYNLAKSAQTLVAFNIDFDSFIITGEMMRNKFSSVPFDRDLLCTMKGMTDFCQLPGGRNGEYKWPKLSEAYQFAFDKPIENAHDAMVDVRACAALHFWLEKKMLCTP